MKCPASNDTEEAPLCLTAGAVATFKTRSKMQLRLWQLKSERHERISLGLETSELQSDMKKWLEDVEKKILGR